MKQGRLTDTVLEFVRTMGRLVSDAEAPVPDGYWEPPAQFVAVDEFERLVSEHAFSADDGSGTRAIGGPWARTAMGWTDYLELLNLWASGSRKFRSVVQRIAEFPGLVYLEIEEHHIDGDNDRTFDSLSIYEFNGGGKICRLRLAGADGWLPFRPPIPVPQDPEDGKVVSFKPKSPTVTEVASGAPLLVDVEFGRGRDLFALSQGVFGGGPPGAPAAPDTGSLVKVNESGGFGLVVDGLDRPTSVEFIRNTAYVVTLTGEIWKVENPSGPPHGASH